MSGPRWFSQPYPPDGANAAEGIRNQLGRPELDLLTLLVRESAQNSWDARLRDGLPVDFRIDVTTVGPAHASSWRELLLAGAPPRIEDFPLRETLLQPVVRLLTVSDRNTRGLGGPTRADRAVGAERDFVSFVRNIGEPRDTPLGGGTYGFGKGIFFRVSKPGTILVHTRCRMPGGTYETRLIGCALWRSYVAEEGGEKRRWTGRHWWGDTSGEVVEPLVGPAAEAAARRLGLRPFAPTETGTTIVVIAPDLDGQEPAEAAGYLAETMAWHLWPKMISVEGRDPAMRLSVTCDGVEHPVPDPRGTLPLKLFVEAYEQMLGPEGESLHCHKPRRLLGRLGLVKRFVPGTQPSRASRLLDIEDAVHHVCLMRPAELVVTYHAGPRPPSVHVGYAGVFRADERMDEVYAKAEPPTHDAWNPQSLGRPESTFVRTTFQRIGEKLNGLLSLSGTARPGATGVALGAASSYFSGLVGGAWGIGGATAYSSPDGSATRTRRGRHQPPPPTGAATGRDGRPAGAGVSGGPEPGATASSTGEAGAAPRRPRVQYVGEPYYQDRAEGTLLVQEFRLPVEGPQHIRIDLAVTLPGTGGRETDPPAGAGQPELVGWEDGGGKLHSGDGCVVLGGGETLWRALVRPAPDTMTEIAVKAEAVRES